MRVLAYPVLEVELEVNKSLALKTCVLQNTAQDLRFGERVCRHVLVNTVLTFRFHRRRKHP
jgi:hypothetical protein